MSLPTATYRIQLHAHFRLEHARRLVPYLHALGISHIYLSPILQARAGSTHGYDVTDPTRVDPEIGTAEELEALAAELRRHEMAIVLDIVPNHMAADVQNPWWRDVLEHGPASPYARFFDIDWGAGEGRVLLPILGAHYGDAIDAGELRLGIGPDGLYLAYYETLLPLDPGTWPDVLDQADGEAPEALRELVARLRGLAPRDEARSAAADRRYYEAQAIKEALWTLHETDVAARAAIARALAAYDVARAGTPAAERLDALLARQAYLPSFWRRATQEMNYRRFFDISDLVGVRVEESEVFEAMHRLVLQWLHAGVVDGTRIDHVDGLFDPTAYLSRLADVAARPDGPTWIVVEKILGGRGRLPPAWPVAGTTGYELLNLVNGLFLDPTGLELLEQDYRRLTGERRAFRDIVYEAKKQVTKQLFAGEIHTLVGALVSVARQDRHGRDLPAAALGRALVEVTARLPVYRTYARATEDGPVIPPGDEALLRETLASARRAMPDPDPGVFDFLERVLLLGPRDQTAAGRLAFLMRWQQVTGPIMAKGLEDTALYRWHPLLSTCEVGSWPPAAVVSPEQFHERMRETAADRPHTLTTLSTHDTKRSGDARARLDVLSELPAEWAAQLARWGAMNAEKRTELADGIAPGPEVEVEIYQLLLAAAPDLETDLAGVGERVRRATLKAIREAKQRTSWRLPIEAYEQATMGFVEALLDDAAFMRDFRAFAGRVAVPGMVNALAQTLLQVTVPGVPDVYQGTECWRFLLVDPDNRRPVDFEAHGRLLAEVLSCPTGDPDGPVPSPDPATLAGWLRAWPDGRIKLHVIAHALRFRRAHAELFAGGDYVPLATSGAHAQNVLGFARQAGASWCMVVVPRLTTRVAGPGVIPLGPVWGDTAVTLPAGAPPTLHDVLTGATATAADDRLRVADLFQALPLGLLHG